MSKAYRIIVDGGEGSPAWTFETDSYEMARDEINYSKEVNDAISSGGYAVLIRETDGFICQDTRHHKMLQAYEDLSAEEYASGIRPVEQAGKTAAKPSVYIDIDGTAAYWYKDGKGFSYPEEILDPRNHYYRNLEAHRFIVDIARKLCDEGHDVCILSATDRCCIADRWGWIEEHMPFIEKGNIFMCPVGADKKEFCKGNADISVLIDDYEKNLGEWSGKALKSINSVNTPSIIYENINTFEAETADWSDKEYNDYLEKVVKLIEDTLRTFDLEKAEIKVINHKYITAPSVKEPYTEFYIDLNNLYYTRICELFLDKTREVGAVEVTARMDRDENIILIAHDESHNNIDVSEALDEQFLSSLKQAIESDTQILIEDHIQALEAFHNMRRNQFNKQTDCRST